jgi:DNA (cytosine-5)-methyltransferase 1
MSEYRAVGLFAGIGGLEVGLHRHGWATELFCEIDRAAKAVLRVRFPGVDQHDDVTRLRALPYGIDLVAAGFPCQDLSQAGPTTGIGGTRSGLVDEVFRLVSRRRGGPRWLLLENVPFMLQLQSGRAMRHLTGALEEHGYRWAYRVVDARAFGLPQRRPRVVLLASRTEDPRAVVFQTDATPPADPDAAAVACGFYWTEGIRGLGWAVDAIPTLKGGSTIGIASPPAIRLPGAGLVTPGISDAERLQGFPPGWTEPALGAPSMRTGHRWKLVGNAVSTRMSDWLGAALCSSGTYDPTGERRLSSGAPWPIAAWGSDGCAYRVDRSSWPVRGSYEHLAGFVHDTKPLSARATAGFLRRARAGGLRFLPGFLDGVADHLRTMGGDPREAA